MTSDSISSIEPMEITTAATKMNAVTNRIQEAVIADTDFIELLLTTVLARGHLHLEDVPGTGKTVAAQILAQALGVSFNRIQFTPDLLPADITGSHVYNEETRDFSFQEGPVFANVVLADEINRAPPKTQAALLEAMGEKQVSIDGDSYDLPKPFFVIATQNPIEQQGTFELPEAQRDRFSIKTSMGYPGEQGEMELLQRRETRDTQIPSVEPALTEGELRRIQSTVESVQIVDAIKQYIISITHATREVDAVKTGVSPRGSQKLFEAARGRAVVKGRDYVIPDDVKQLAMYVYPHRLVLTEEALMQSTDEKDVMRNVVNQIPVPNVTGK